VTRAEVAGTGKWVLLLAVCAQFMIAIDVSIVNVALPSVGAALHLSRADLSWVVNAYSLTFGGLLLLDELFLTDHSSGKA
jgi:MFS family permease